MMFNNINQLVLIFLFLLVGNLASASAGELVGEVALLNNDGVALTYRGKIIVFLEPQQATVDVQAPSEDIVISQRGRRFRPSVLPIIKGSSLAFPNDDKVLHNVFSLSKTEPFDLGNYKKGESRSITFNNTGRVKVYCNIHPEMELDVLVLNTPFYTTTDKDGKFSIADVPKGDYQLRVWHELTEPLSLPITISDGALTSPLLTIQQTKTPTEHNNKYGKPYRGKY